MKSGDGSGNFVTSESETSEITPYQKQNKRLISESSSSTTSTVQNKKQHMDIPELTQTLQDNNVEDHDLIQTLRDNDIEILSDTTLLDAKSGDVVTLRPDQIPNHLVQNFRAFKKLYKTLFAIRNTKLEFSIRIDKHIPVIKLSCPPLALPCTQLLNPQELDHLEEHFNKTQLSFSLAVYNLLTSKEDQLTTAAFNALSILKHNCKDNEFDQVRTTAIIEATCDYRNRHQSAKPIRKQTHIQNLKFYKNGKIYTSAELANSNGPSFIIQDTFCPPTQQANMSQIFEPTLPTSSQGGTDPVPVPELPNINLQSKFDQINTKFEDINKTLATINATLHNNRGGWGKRRNNFPSQQQNHQQGNPTHHQQHWQGNWRGRNRGKKWHPPHQHGPRPTTTWGSAMAATPATSGPAMAATPATSGPAMAATPATSGLAKAALPATSGPAMAALPATSAPTTSTTESTAACQHKVARF